MQDWWTDGQTNKLFPADFNQAYLDPPIQSTVIYTLAAQSNETKQDWADFRVLIWIGSTISFKIFKLRFYMKLYEIQLYNWYNCFYPLFLPPLSPCLGDLGMGLQPAGASECFDFRHQFVLSAGTKEFGILDFFPSHSCSQQTSHWFDPQRNAV